MEYKRKLKSRKNLNNCRNKVLNRAQKVKKDFLWARVLLETNN